MARELNKLLKKFNQLYFLRKKFDEKSNELLEKMQKMTPIIEGLMIDEGVNKVSFTNGITTKLQSTTWAKIIDKAKAIRLLKRYQKKMNTDKYVLGERVNHQGLSAFIRECEKHGDLLPKNWTGVIEANPVVSIVPKKL